MDDFCGGGTGLLIAAVIQAWFPFAARRLGNRRELL